MNSPYFQGNVGSGWGPPAGISSVLALDRQTAMAGPKELGDAVEAFGKQFKQQQDEGKAAEYLFKAHPEYLEQLGIHPEQFKTLGAVDKSRAAGAVMRDQAMRDMMAKRADMESQTNERNAIANWRQSQASRTEQEDQGLARMFQEMLTPKPQIDGAGMMMDIGPTPPAMRSPADSLSPELKMLLESGASAGQMNPKVQAMIMREVLPHLTGGDGGTGGPNFYEDPVSGNRWAVKGKVMAGSGVNPNKVSTPNTVDLHDENGNVNGQAMWDGKHWVSRPVGKTPTLPAEFHTTLDKIGEDLARSQNVLDSADDELKQRSASATPTAQRAAAKRVQVAAQARAKSTIDRYHTTGYLTEDQRNQFYDEMGLAKPAAANSGGSNPDERVAVKDKDGKQFTVPKGQLSDALKAGYTEVK